MSYNSERVRKLNDKLRKKHIGGSIAITPGISSLGPALIAEILDEVAFFNKFTSENDPYDERDFGALTVQNQRIFWKIDYFDILGTTEATNPSDPKATKRVLTVLLASEY